MGLKQERERIYLDMKGRIATNTKKQNAKYTSEMIKNADKDSKEYKRKYENLLKYRTEKIYWYICTAWYNQREKSTRKQDIFFSNKSRKIYKDNVETAVLFDSRGNVLFRESSGASNYVKFSKEQLSKMKGATLTHNHPSSSTFSPADVSIMTEQGLNVIRATGTSKTYQLKKLNGAEVNHDFSIDYEKAMSDNKKITDKDFRKYEKERKQGKISPLEYQDKINALNKKWNDLNSDWLKKNSKNYGYKYGVIERGK